MPYLEIIVKLGDTTHQYSKKVELSTIDIVGKQLPEANIVREHARIAFERILLDLLYEEYRQGNLCEECLITETPSCLCIEKPENIGIATRNDTPPPPRRDVGCTSWPHP